jgi:hypothetical protein
MRRYRFRGIPLALYVFLFGGAMNNPRAALDPVGQIHIPIGIANTLDPLKTFVEAEGVISPGFATYGIYFWVYDVQAARLLASTEQTCTHGLNDTGSLIPWSSWQANNLNVKTEICEVAKPYGSNQGYVTAVRLTIKNLATTQRQVKAYSALRPMGPAGWTVKALSVGADSSALLVDGHTALVASQPVSAAGVSNTDNIGATAQTGGIPAAKTASSTGTCSGALRQDLTLAAGETKVLQFVCPVLPGKRAWRHQWDGVDSWAQHDLAAINPDTGGILQPDPGLDAYKQMNVDQLFTEATNYWKSVAGNATIVTPDKRWAECLAAIIGHTAISVNEHAPDVTVINYNTYNRDGTYTANILQKSGNLDLAAGCITDYFFKHPFSGRSYPEADNPGQILWVTGQQWLFGRDKAWLQTVYPSVQKIAAMIHYYRTTTGTLWINMNGLDFGSAVPANQRRQFTPGACDGTNFNYTEAYDLAGIRAAIAMAQAMGNTVDEQAWQKFADSLFTQYDAKYGGNLGDGYGSYSVLWPCRLYPLTSGKAFDQFRNNGASSTGEWRYFPLARSHQGLLAGNRAAGYQTINNHLADPQMQGWYAFDEGGGSGTAGWEKITNWTKWDPGTAMPHGWANAEVFLLLRDCLAFEDGSQVLLMPGVDEAWFKGPNPVQVSGLETWFGKLTYKYICFQGYAELRLGSVAQPPLGFVLRLPASLSATVTIGGTAVPSKRTIGSNIDYEIPLGTATVKIQSAQITGSGIVADRNGLPGTPPDPLLTLQSVTKGLSVIVSGPGVHRLDILDLAGRMIVSRQGVGNQRYRFDASCRLQKGTYVVRLTNGDGVVSKMMAVK